MPVMKVTAIAVPLLYKRRRRGLPHLRHPLRGLPGPHKARLFRSCRPQWNIAPERNILQR